MMNQYCFVYFMRVQQSHSMVIITKLPGNNNQLLIINNAELIIDITSFTLTIDINKFKVTFLT